MEENASRALLMAAGVLLGIMILSIGVYLFSTYAEYSSNAYARMEETQIEQFNTQFFKYYGQTQSQTDPTRLIPILLTAHDVITITNLAKQNNVQMEVENQPGYAYYIQIDVVKKSGAVMPNFEQKDDDYKLRFIQQNITWLVDKKDADGNYIFNADGTKVQEVQRKFYYCVDPPRVDSSTKRVCYMQLREYVP